MSRTWWRAWTRWPGPGRGDRRAVHLMSTVRHPGPGRVTASLPGWRRLCGRAAVCPPRRGGRKGVAEKVSHTAANAGGAPCPTMSDPNRPKPTSTGLAAHVQNQDAGRPPRGDSRSPRSPQRNRCNPFGATVSVIVAEERTASCQALGGRRGNRYSVRRVAMARVMVTCPVGGESMDIATSGGIVIARNRRLPTASAPPSAMPGT